MIRSVNIWVFMYTGRPCYSGGGYQGTRITRLRDSNTIVKICEMIEISSAKYAVCVHNVYRYNRDRGFNKTIEQIIDFFPLKLFLYFVYHDLIQKSQRAS